MAGGCWVVQDFHSGKRTVRGEPNPALRRYEVVTVVARDRITDLLRTRTRQETTRLLRTLRDDGLLIAPLTQPRLQHRVRGDDGKRFRAYAFDCPDPAYVAAAAERIRRER